MSTTVGGIDDDHDHIKEDYRIIVQRFMKELCKKDDEDNRGISSNLGGSANVFPVDQIRQAVLEAYTLERVMLALRGYILENKGNEPFEFLDDETNVRLTNAGRARCNEYRGM